ncbi:DCC1-like thiol-disulfide oxidoreductase family protein [Ureibacillus chungkukjangi]|uniref:thiol-disulfide oxidoreductase DCC family protein n=1 Tax=Ureibacillus chungkukjangi TaxID=1202712 RepID=UPI002041BB28|nr:DCC1-like thiol-disulfide oxidoreductase family protein [Ureibacillus chungkukjangi]MCM3388067.1 DCC1-like thiol-disulfide oxidoreductase family protein [Ureibacillus chungkukjangi]
MNIILFDGDCHFCNTSVQFIIKRDQKKYFKFASLQSEIGQKLLEEFQIPKTTDSLIFIEGNSSYIKSTAALKICRRLDGMWKLLYPFLIIPKFLRNTVYDVVAKNRHKLMKQTECRIPTKEELERFLH